MIVANDQKEETQHTPDKISNLLSALSSAATYVLSVLLIFSLLLISAIKTSSLFDCIESVL